MSPTTASAPRSAAPWTFAAAAECVRLQDWPAARLAYESLAREHPDHVEVMCNLGLIEQLLQDWPAALQHFDQAVGLQPDTARPYLLRADLHKVCARLDEALADYEAALQHGAVDDLARAHIHANRGTTLHALGRHEDALASFDQALCCDAQTPGLHYNRGNALRSLSRHEEALASFDQALQDDSDDLQAQFNRGLSLGALGRWQSALDSADAVLHQRPDHAGAHSARGDWLKNLGRADDALAAYDEALRLDDRRSATHLNRGNTLRELDRPEEALLAYDQAVAINPADWEGHYNRGIALHDLRRLPQAMRSYSLARRLAPHEAKIEWNEALALLLDQQWHEGWLAYEARWRLDPPMPPMVTLGGHTGRPWRGVEPLAGRRILLVAEQGLGDTLQFCRYVPHVLAQGAGVTLLVPQSLKRLMQSLAPGIRVASQLGPQERFDFHCPLMSLPLALNRFDPHDGGPEPYLHAETALVADVARRHPRGAMPRVGLAWSGNRQNLSDARRSLALEEFVQALPPGLELVVLQADIRQEDQAVLQAMPGLIHDAHGLAGFAQTAALCEGLDLVVTVDTSIAHLAGALGRPTWVLLHHACDWRWLADREDSPWYPQARLFRQHRPGRWPEVLQRVHSALELALLDRSVGPFSRPFLGPGNAQPQACGTPAQ